MTYEEDYQYTDHYGDSHALDYMDKAARKIERRMNACFCGASFTTEETSNGREFYRCERGHKEVNND